MAPEIPIFLVCLVLSAFFSGSETALLSASRLRLRRRVAEGNHAAHVVLDLVHDPRRLLAGLLVGNNIVNVLAASAATSYCLRLLPPGTGVAVATAVSTVTLVLFSEFLPKTVAALHPIGWALAVATPIRWVLWLLAPMVVPLEAITRPLGALLRRSREGFGIAEVRMAVSEGVRTGAVDETLAQVLRGGLSLSWKTVADALIPRVDVARVDVDADFAACREIFRKDGYSRLLVMDGTPDNDLGYVSAKDLTLVAEEERPAWRVRDSVRESLRVPPSLPLPRLLARMRVSGVHFATVKDEYGGTEGIVTLEDLLEELVGEIRDEHDEVEVPPMVKVRPNLWLVRGDLSVKELQDRLEVTLPAAEARTVGGLIAERLGRVAVAGDALDLGLVHLLVERAEENRVLRVRVERRRPTA